jgi:hypothetical protein
MTRWQDRTQRLWGWVLAFKELYQEHCCVTTLFEEENAEYFLMRYLREMNRC